MNTLQEGRKPAIEYSAELLELHDSEPEEIARFGEDLNLDDWETVIARIVQACDVLLAQREREG